MFNPLEALKLGQRCLAEAKDAAGVDAAETILGEQRVGVETARLTKASGPGNLADSTISVAPEIQAETQGIKQLPLLPESLRELHVSTKLAHLPELPRSLPEELFPMRISSLPEFS